MKSYNRMIGAGNNVHVQTPVAAAAVLSAIIILLCITPQSCQAFAPPNSKLGRSSSCFQNVHVSTSNSNYNSIGTITGAIHIDTRISPLLHLSPSMTFLSTQLFAQPEDTDNDTNINNSNNNTNNSNNNSNSNNKNTSKEEKLSSFQKDIQNKFTEDRSYNAFGFLTPLAKSLDSVSGDWALSYADLQPATPRTIEGQAFLATNVCYAVAGIVLAIQGDWFFALLTEMAGIVSFWYHYSQLEFGANREEVRLALLTDYFTAGAALVTGGLYMADMGISGVPLDAVFTGAGAVVCLSLCWVWEFGQPYLFWHSMWHILSAYTGFLVGQAHIGR